MLLIRGGVDHVAVRYKLGQGTVLAYQQKRIPEINAGLQHVCRADATKHEHDTTPHHAAMYA